MPAFRIVVGRLSHFLFHDAHNYIFVYCLYGCHAFFHCSQNNLLRYIQSLEGADLLRNQEVIEVQSMTAQKRHVIEEELIALQSTDSYVYDSLPLVKPITT